MRTRAYAGLASLATAALIALQAVAPAMAFTRNAVASRSVAQKQVSFNKISFSYDTSLATDVTGRVVPRVEGEAEPIWEVAPQHVRFVFKGLPTGDDFYEQGFGVYPTDEYAQMNELATDEVAALKTLLAQKPDLGSRYPLYDLNRTPATTPPFLPPANAALVLTTHLSYINFRNGSGIRYLTQGKQDCSPLDADRLLYVVAGLANNGKDLVAAGFEVKANRSLDPVPRPRAGQECQVFDDYNKRVAPTIAAMKANEFTPNLDLLDQVFTSLSTVPVLTSYNFPQTGITVSGRVWEVWQGGRSFDESLYINGVPLTTLRAEVNPTDGKTYETQWFERARFELHSENAAPNDVLLGLLGVVAGEQQYKMEGPFRAVSGPQGAGLQFFPETGHTLGSAEEGGRAIARFWTELGGLRQFGYPISEVFIETSKEDGKEYMVQYFQRQRFEYHPELKNTRFEVLLGRLGAEQMPK